MAGKRLKALKELIKRVPTDKDIDLMYEEILTEKRDRGAALVTATFLEESLRNFVRSRMVSLTTAEYEALFERDAPLSSFSKLIRVAHGFGLIDAAIRRECDCIREVRNAFAHSPVALAFDTPEVAAVCMLLSRHFDTFEGIDSNHPKARYIGAATGLAAILNSARKNKDIALPVVLPH